MNNSFTGDAGGQLVHRKAIRRAVDGVTLEGERPADERSAEFAASRDTWVRVVNFANAPDGCLYVVDMYREVIEHPWSIPDEIKKHLDLNSGRDRGRIYRIVPERGAPRVGTRVTLADAGPGELVEMLSHANGWHRDTAHRLLVERGDGSVVAPLRRRLLEGGTVEKLHALGVLSGLHALTQESLLGVLGDPDPEVRARGLLLLGGGTAGVENSTALAGVFSKLAEDESPAVRFQLALTIARLLEKEAGEGLMEPVVRLAEKDGTHPWIGAATLGVPVAVLQKKVFPKMAEKKRWNRGEVAYMERLLEVCAASAGNSEIAALLEFVGATGPRLEWVRALGAGFRAARTTLEKVDSRGVLTGWMESNARRAADGTLPVEERVAAIRALGFASERTAAPALFACLSKQEPAAVQSVAVEELLRKGTDAWRDAVFSRAGDLSKDACNVMVRALLARTDGPLRLLAAVKAGQIAPTLLSASDVQSLVKAKDAKVAAEAMRVLAARLPPSREEMLGKYREAVSLEGDGDKGRTVFQQRCMACHVAEGQGMAVGPDLVTVKTKGRDGLLGAIVDPNREVAAQYLQYTVQTKDHETLAGVVTEDTAAGMTLKMAGGSARTVERSRILSASSTGQSLMPEGLEAGMTVRDMADLLTFIETLR